MGPSDSGPQVEGMMHAVKLGKTIASAAVPLGLLATVCVGALQAQSTTVIRTARVLDGRGQVLVDRDLVVRGGHIVEITDAGQARGDDIHDLTGLTVLPGLIDTHVHVGWHFAEDGRLARGTELADRVMYAAENAHRMLRAGVTTVQSLGGAEDGPLRRALEIRFRTGSAIQ